MDIEKKEYDRLMERVGAIARDNDKLRLALQRWKLDNIRICEKYGVNSRGRVYNLQSGKEIPEGEPLFLFRGKDVHLPDVLFEYADRCTNDTHRQLVLRKREEVEKWQEENSTLVGEPNTDPSDYDRGPEPDAVGDAMAGVLNDIPPQKDGRKSWNCTVRGPDWSGTHKEVVATEIDNDGNLVMENRDGVVIIYNRIEWSLIEKEPSR